VSQTKAPCGSFDARAAETRLAGGLASWALLLGHEHELGHVDYWRGDEPPPRNDDRDWGAAWAAVATAVRNRRAREASRPRFWPPLTASEGSPGRAPAALARAAPAAFAAARTPATTENLNQPMI